MQLLLRHSLWVVRGGGLLALVLSSDCPFTPSPTVLPILYLQTFFCPTVCLSTYIYLVISLFLLLHGPQCCFLVMFMLVLIAK